MQNNNNLYVIKINNKYYWVGANLISEQIKDAKIYVSLSAAKRNVSDLQTNPGRKRLVVSQIIDRETDFADEYSKKDIVEKTTNEITFNIVEVAIIEKSVL